MRVIHAVVIAGAVVLGAPGTAGAHFKLLEPHRGSSRMTAAIHRKRLRAAVIRNTGAIRATPLEKPSAARTCASGFTKRSITRVIIASRWQSTRRRAAAHPPTTTRTPRKAPIGVGGRPEPAAEAGFADGLFPHYRGRPRRRRSRPTFSCRTSTARSARYKSLSGWPSTPTTIPVDTRITTAPICRSRPTRRTGRRGMA